MPGTVNVRTSNYYSVLADEEEEYQDGLFLSAAAIARIAHSYDYELEETFYQTAFLGQIYYLLINLLIEIYYSCQELKEFNPEELILATTIPGVLNGCLALYYWLAKNADMPASEAGKSFLYSATLGCLQDGIWQLLLTNKHKVLAISLSPLITSLTFLSLHLEGVEIKNKIVSSIKSGLNLFSRTQVEEKTSERQPLLSPNPSFV